MIPTGHSLGGGAAFLATLVLSCLTQEKGIVCVSFGQPRVLIAPPIGELAVLSWHDRKLQIMQCLHNQMSASKISYHRVLGETDPIALIPTRVPTSLGGRGERFVHVPDAVVISRGEGESGEVFISEKRNTKTLNPNVYPRNAMVESFFRGLTTLALIESHRMQHYRKLLRSYPVEETSSHLGALFLSNTSSESPPPQAFIIPYDPHTRKIKE